MAIVNIRDARRLAGTFLAASILFLICTAQAVAETEAPRPVADADLVALIAAGRIEEAKALYSTIDPNETDWLFFDARVAKAEGRLDDAIALFREVLRRDPQHLPAQRELGHSLLLIAEYRAAAYHFRDLLERDSSSKFRQSYIHFLDQIDRLRPFSLRSRFAIVSSSNVNRGSSESVFNPGVPDVPSFDITSQAETGYGVELGLSGHHRWLYGERSRVTFDWGVLGHKYNKSIHDRASLTARLQIGTLSEKGQWSVGPFARATWEADDGDNTALGIAASYDRRLTTRVVLFIGAASEYRRYLNFDAQDGPLHSLQIGIARPAFGGQLSGGTRLTFNRPERAHQQYDGQALFANYTRSWSGGLNLGFNLNAGRRNYGGDFPLLGEPRNDRFYQFGVSVQHDSFHIGRLSPVINCLVGKTHSNAAFFDHNVTECRLSVTKRF